MNVSKNERSVKIMNDIIDGLCTLRHLNIITSTRYRMILERLDACSEEELIEANRQFLYNAKLVGWL